MASSYTGCSPAVGTTIHACNATTFSSLSLHNVNITSLDVSKNIGIPMPDIGYTPPVTHDEVLSVDMCLLTINYTHPGDDDAITTWVGLPLNATSWNGRFVMSGGGAWVAGILDSTTVDVGSGFTSASTNAGHGGSFNDPPSWGLWSNGTVNLPALEDFASRAIFEAVRFGKQATELYFGKKPDYSYWNGCSTGGRQGHAIAEKIPEEFDGIIAGSPAIYWSKLLITGLWGYVIASEYGISPPPCVFDALTEAAVNACDELDGVKDSIISLPGLCDFDPFSLVGKSIECSDIEQNIMITKKMANLIREIWTGPSTPDGEFIWYGLTPGAELITPIPGVAWLTSDCTTVENCTLSSFPVSQGWIQTFLQHETSPGNFSLTRHEFYRYLKKSVEEYTAIMSYSNPDLTRLKKSGTKMIVWHGLADQLIPANDSINYYERVCETMGHDVDDFYRLFLAPGVSHCGGPSGLSPTPDIFFELVAWAENGTAPDTITGTGPAVGPDNTTATRTVNLCSYPKVLVFNGTDPNDPQDFTCV